MKEHELKQLCDNMVELLPVPWIQNSKFADFRADCEKLLQLMTGYYKHLTQQKERNKLHHQAPQPKRSMNYFCTIFKILFFFFVINSSNQVGIIGLRTDAIIWGHLYNNFISIWECCFSSIYFIYAQ